MPNAAPTPGPLLGLSVTKRVPAFLNYTAGPEGLKAACTAAKIQIVVASRAFIERARLGALLQGLAPVEIIYLEDLRSRLSWLDKIWILACQRFPRMEIFARLPATTAKSAVADISGNFFITILASKNRFKGSRNYS